VRRELAIALRARSTWLVAAIAALLVGHGFVLAVDIYSVSSRSALSSVLQTREMDPLAAIVRPTLGGLSLALSLLVPIIAARTLSIEKERRTYGALCLAVGSTTRVIAQKAVASLAAGALLLTAPVVLLIAFVTFGGHIDAIETTVALGGELLRLSLLVAIATAAAAWTRTFAQAVTLGMLASLTSWAIDAADGFAALAWLGGASSWSIDQRLLPFQRGILSLGSLIWLLVATTLALCLAFLGGSFSAMSRKAELAGACIVAGALALASVGTVRRGFDWSEQRRASLPPAAVDALRKLPQPISLEVFLDRDDSRRRQLENDALAKLVLARSDIAIRMPLDAAPEVIEAQRSSSYGRILIRVGDAVRQTRSTSRRELVTLIFEAAGQHLADWTQPAYPGFPTVLTGVKRRALGIFAYLVVPSSFAALGLALTHRRTMR
jgi:hypothetical protein